MPTGASTRYYRPMHAVASSCPGKRAKFFALVVVAIAAGCAQVRHEQPSPEAPPPPPAPRYEAVIGQDPATVAELRAEPAPKEAELTIGKTPQGDEELLNSKGYARIGDGYLPVGDPRAWALQQALLVGADKVLIYGADADGSTHATFYVRYRLPFGATFRTLNADEQRTLGSGGVQLGEIVGGTPASEANLRRGDFVIKFNGKPFADRAAFQLLLRENMGKRVTLTISRNGSVLDRLVRLGVSTKPKGNPQK